MPDNDEMQLKPGTNILIAMVYVTVACHVIWPLKETTDGSNFIFFVGYCTKMY